MGVESSERSCDGEWVHGYGIVDLEDPFEDFGALSETWREPKCFREFQGWSEDHGGKPMELVGSMVTNIL